MGSQRVGHDWPANTHKVVEMSSFSYTRSPLASHFPWGSPSSQQLPEGLESSFQFDCCPRASSLHQPALAHHLMYNIPGASYLALPLTLPLLLQLTASDCFSTQYLSGSAPKINNHAVPPPPPRPHSCQLTTLGSHLQLSPLLKVHLVAPGGKFMSTDKRGLSANSQAEYSYLLTSCFWWTM